MITSPMSTGYPDGRVGPLNNITRAEVAAIFYRLLRKDMRMESQTTENSFDDVPAERMVCHGGFHIGAARRVCGTDNRCLAPDAPSPGQSSPRSAPALTRAEPRRTETSPISAGTGRSSISGQASALGWVQGYPDGTFGPDRPITRAEAVTMINRVLRRNPGSKDDLFSGMKVWPDQSSGGVVLPGGARGHQRA